jgi:hypothetical protein
VGCHKNKRIEFGYTREGKNGPSPAPISAKLEPDPNLWVLLPSLTKKNSPTPEPVGFIVIPNKNILY